MAFIIKEPPEFTTDIPQWTRETYADGPEMSKVPEALLNNEVYLKEKLENVEKNSVQAAGGNISETKIDTVAEVQESFPVPAAGEDTKTFLGKVKKSLEDLKAIKDGIITVGRLVNNGLTTESGFALDARFGKTLFDYCDRLNNSLNNCGLKAVSLTQQKTVSPGNTTYTWNISGYRNVVCTIAEISGCSYTIEKVTMQHHSLDSCVICTLHNQTISLRLTVFYKG